MDLMQMNDYITGGYQILYLKPLNYGNLKGKIVHSCSGCVNLAVFDNWCQSWTQTELNSEEKEILKLNDEKIRQIEKWTESKFDNCPTLFHNLEEAVEFKDLFLKGVGNLNIYSINFSDKEADQLIYDFSEGKNTNDYNYNNGNLVLRQNLLERVPEDSNGKFLGFDIIGVESDGSFHSFICTDATKELKKRFGMTVNTNGLFDEIYDTPEFREFLKDDFYFELVPYYVCKVEKVVV